MPARKASALPEQNSLGQAHDACFTVLERSPLRGAHCVREENAHPQLLGWGVFLSRHCQIVTVEFNNKLTLPQILLVWLLGESKVLLTLERCDLPYTPPDIGRKEY